MTENKTRAILLYNKLSSENNLYLKFLTDNDEVLTGICFGGSSKKKKNIYQVGYFLNLNVKVKNSNFPNNISGELSRPYFYDIFKDKYKLHSLLSIISLLNLSIIEGQKITGIFNSSEKIINMISIQENWLVDYFLYLLNLLKLIGYEIDFIKNQSLDFLNLDTLQFNNINSNKSIIFPHNLLNKSTKINLENVNSFFKIFEIILQNHHLNNMNLNIPSNYLKFKKLILEFLSKK
jgi:hypothetical protein